MIVGHTPARFFILRIIHELLHLFRFGRFVIRIVFHVAVVFRTFKILLRHKEKFIIFIKKKFVCGLARKKLIIYCTSIFKLLALLSSVNVRPRPLSAELSPPRRVIFDAGIFGNDKRIKMLRTEYC